jgi:hypothetical protein
MSKKQFNPIIQTTKDYHKFKLITGNRDISPMHIKRLKHSISQNPLISLITINERYEIIDGQHRFHAFKELGLPIHYIIVYGYGIKEVQILNANSTNWKKNDFLEGHAKNGNEAYIKFKQFQEDFPSFNFSTCLKVLSNLRSEQTKTYDGIKTQSKDFEQGLFEIPNIKKSYEIANMIMDYKPYFDKFNHTTFISTLLYLFQHPNYNHKQMLSKLKLQPNALVVCRTQTQYALILEGVFNYHTKNKVSLRYL